MLKDRLKKLREDSGLTKKEVAIKVGITERAYIAYEYGERDVSTETLSKLADFYGVSTDYLLCRSDIKPMLTVNEMEKRLVKSYFSVPPKLRAEFLKSMLQEYMKQEGITQTITPVDIAARSPDDISKTLNKDILQKLTEDTSEEI